MALCCIEARRNDHKRSNAECKLTSGASLDVILFRRLGSCNAVAELIAAEPKPLSNTSKVDVKKPQ